MSQQRQPIPEIVRLLGCRALELCHWLKLRGRVDGREFVAFNPTRPDRHLGSFRIRLSDGIWKDFATDEAGDALALIKYCEKLDGWAEALAKAREFLGLDGKDFEALRRTREAAIEAARKPPETPNRWAGRAMQLWLQAAPAIAGTPAERYLAGRGIDLQRLGRQLRALRYHPELFCREAGRPLPAMVAGITCPETVDEDGVVTGANIRAIHRTWLAVRPDGRVSKAPLCDPKRTLGRYPGGSIRLWRGATAKPVAKIQPGEPILLSEGIEDGLTAALAMPDARVWAIVSLGNLRALWLPADCIPVLLQQNDTNPKTILARERALQALWTRGFRPRVAPAPAIVKDINDLLTGAGAPAAHARGDAA
jgi:hypothetical protein